MSKVNYFLTIILAVVFLFVFNVLAANYSDGTLLRAEGDIKVYLVNNNIKRWVSSLEVFDSYNFSWKNVKVVSKKEVSAIPEGELIGLVVSPTPVVLANPSPSSTPSPIPPIPAKINPDLPEIEYVRADWLISHTTVNYGKVGQRIVFKYSSKEKDKIENFNLYEKKPGSQYFYKSAGFEEILSIGCEDIDINGQWMITEAGECGYWSIQRVIPPAQRGDTAYLPASDYLIGEYVYYVAGADKDGFETKPSAETKLIFLDPVDILSPVDGKQINGIYPTFEWTIAGGWPVGSVADYFVMISDNINAPNPVWTKQFKISSGETSKKFEYDGLALDSNNRYKVNIYGHYRKSEHDPDYIHIPLNAPEFLIKKSLWTTVFKSIFASLFNLFF